MIVPKAIEQKAKTKPAAGVNISAAKENALGILAQTSSDARKLPTSEQQTSVSKPQAEFLPPSSGPSPSYVRSEIVSYLFVLFK